MQDKLRNKFFVDPDWKEVEKLLMEFINPIMDINSLPTDMPAAEYKANILVRRELYEKLLNFFAQTGMVGNPDEHRRTSFK